MTAINNLNEFRAAASPYYAAYTDAYETVNNAKQDKSTAFNAIAHQCVIALANNVDVAPLFKKDGAFHAARSAMTYARKIKETLLDTDKNVSAIQARVSNGTPIPFHIEGDGTEWTSLTGIEGWRALINADTSNTH